MKGDFKKTQCFLELEDGSMFEGYSFGSLENASGEVGK